MRGSATARCRHWTRLPSCDRGRRRRRAFCSRRGAPSALVAVCDEAVVDEAVAVVPVVSAEVLGLALADVVERLLHVADQLLVLGVVGLAELGVALLDLPALRLPAQAGDTVHARDRIAEGDAALGEVLGPFADGPQLLEGEAQVLDVALGLGEALRAAGAFLRAARGDLGRARLRLADTQRLVGRRQRPEVADVVHRRIADLVVARRRRQLAGDDVLEQALGAGTRRGLPGEVVQALVGRVGA